MKNSFLLLFALFSSLFSMQISSQTKDKPVTLGLPGDNLDLYAVLEVFQKSKTIEDFEKSLNEEKSKLNNLDLDNNKKVDFIKVITNKDGDSFSFILQVPINKTENQDVAVIFVSKDKSGRSSIQIVGDEDLYGKNYIVEPKGSSLSGNTVNPGYSNEQIMNIPAQTTTTTVIVQSPPIVQYVYSPAYVPYYPPYYYGFYPPYFHPFVPISSAIFWSNNFYCHGGYYGGYQGSVNININNSNHYNNYNNNSRNRSTTVANNTVNGNYGNKVTTGNNMNRANTGSTRESGDTSGATRPGGGTSATRPTSPSTKESGSGMTRPTSPSTRESGSGMTRPTSPSTKESGSGMTRPTSPSTRPATSPTARPSNSSKYTRPSSSSSTRNSRSNTAKGRTSTTAPTRAR